MVHGCSLDSPSSPNSPGDLQGNVPNVDTSFQGTVRISVPGTVLPADDNSALSVTAVVEDGDGNPASNLTPVIFRTTLGTFGDPSADYAATTVTVNSFGGRATAELRSFQQTTGTATVVASVGNVSAQVEINLGYVQARGFLSLAFRLQGQDFFNMTGVASPADPFRVGIVAMATDPSGNPLPGARVTFRIVVDDTTGSAAGPARLEGQPTSFTDADGEGFNQLQVVGVGRVVLEADLVDAITGAIISTSNQIIMTTISTVQLKLTINNGGTATGGSSKNLKAEATDASGKVVPYVFVKFELQADATSAAWLNPESTVATEWGIARSVLNFNGGTAGDVTTVVAKVVDSEGTVLATSNTVDNIY
jgi:hypothetical protein